MGIFSYENSLGREYKNEKWIESVIFDISRYGKYTATLSFPEPVSEAEAVAAAERWLSEPFDRAYWERVGDDCFVGITSYQDALDEGHYKVRGDCLSDCVFLETVRRLSNKQISLECGS